MTSAAWRSLTSLGELALLFLVALRGSFRQPFYWRELLEQRRFILTANYPLLDRPRLPHHRFDRGRSLLPRRQRRVQAWGLHGHVEHSRVLSGGDRLMIAAVSGTAIVADVAARQVPSELEALSVMGLSNLLFLVVPRAPALMLMTAFYNFPNDRLHNGRFLPGGGGLGGVNSGAGGHENGSRQQRKDDSDDMFD